MHIPGFKGRAFDATEEKEADVIADELGKRLAKEAKVTKNPMPLPLLMPSPASYVAHKRMTCICTSKREGRDSKSPSEGDLAALVLDLGIGIGIPYTSMYAQLLHVHTWYIYMYVGLIGQSGQCRCADRQETGRHLQTAVQ